MANNSNNNQIQMLGGNPPDMPSGQNGQPPELPSGVNSQNSNQSSNN